MKNLLLLTTLCLLCVFNLNSQHHFPKDSAEWKLWVINNGVPYSSKLIIRSYDRDTLLDGEEFKIVKSGFIGNESYIREVDSIQKVYFKFDQSDTVSNRLLYDFSKTVGDSIEVVSYFDSPQVIHSPVMINWYVDSEGYINVGTSQRRFLDVKREGWNYYDRWIEGIGSVRGLFAPINEPSGWFEVSFQLVCFTDKGAGVQYEPFPSNKYNCNTPAHVFHIPESNLDKGVIEVYPNPFTAKITFENIFSELIEFSLFNSGGIKVMEGELGSFEKQIINTEDFEPGLYFMMSEHDGRVFTRKIVCEGKL